MFEKNPEAKLKNNPPTNQPVAGEEISVQTIPADFYGGVNPVVKFKRVEREVALGEGPKLTEPEKKMLDKSTAAGSGDPLHPTNILANRKYALIFGASFFVIIVAGVSTYYYLQLRQQPKNNLPAQPKISITTTSIPTPAVDTTTPEAEVSTTTPQSLAEAPIDFPSSLLGDSPDLDKDNLTDAAEDLFITDPSKPDTDSDGYNDGHEVFYMYNPAGKEPIRLIASGNVKDYENPVLGYKVFYPTTWAVGNVDETHKDVLFSTITGENIELRTFDLLPGQTFTDWFAKWAPNEQFANLADFQTYFQQPGKNRKDNLVYYFTDNSHVYVLLYHTTDSNIVNYRSILVMMARSFRTQGFAPPAILPAVPENSGFPTDMPATINSTNQSS